MSSLCYNHCPLKPDKERWTSHFFFDYKICTNYIDNIEGKEVDKGYSKNMFACPSCIFYLLCVIDGTATHLRRMHGDPSVLSARKKRENTKFLLIKKERVNKLCKSYKKHQDFDRLKAEIKKAILKEIDPYECLRCKHKFNLEVEGVL